MEWLYSEQAIYCPSINAVRKAMPKEEDECFSDVEALCIQQIFF